jgi:hypothetical protein
MQITLSLIADFPAAADIDQTETLIQEAGRQAVRANEEQYITALWQRAQFHSRHGWRMGGQPGAVNVPGRICGASSRTELKPSGPAACSSMTC